VSTPGRKTYPWSAAPDDVTPSGFTLPIGPFQVWSQHLFMIGHGMPRDLNRAVRAINRIGRKYR